MYSRIGCLVDCADPECNGAGHPSLEPGPDRGPQVCNPPSCPATLHEGLQAFYQFENNTQDSSGNEHDGTINGDPGYVSGLASKRATALELDGEDDWVEVPDEERYEGALDLRNAVTMTAWIKPEKPSGDFQGVVGKRTNSAYHLFIQGNKLYFDILNENGDRVFQGKGSIQADTWQHVAGTYSKDTGTMRWYIDGQLVGTASQTGSIAENDYPVGIGYPQYSDQYFNGTIDQVRIYNRTLTDTEIKSFVNSSCNNRQRTVECVNSPELCDTDYASRDRYHCNYGDFDNPKENGSYENAKTGTGVCCPPDTDLSYDTFNKEWSCEPSAECGIDSDDPCPYNITNNETAWFAEKSDGISAACNSQVSDLYVDTTEQPEPEQRSQACCYVSKDGKMGFYYKDGNVKVYG